MTGASRRDRRGTVGVTAPPEGGLGGPVLPPDVMARGIGATSQFGSRYNDSLDHRSAGLERPD